MAKLQGVARRLMGLPGARSALIALRLLYVHLILRGQARRDRRGFCVDGRGQPIPWLTYPAIDYFSALDVSDCRVFEFGVGSSTLFWSARAKAVAGVEMERDWFEKIERLALPNVTLKHCGDGGQYPREIASFEGGFDLIVVDGAERYRSAEAALAKLNPGGIIVLDNREWYPNTAELLRSRGLLEVDFCGFAPLNSRPSVTSLFFSRDAEPKWRSPFPLPPGVTPLRGGALDDGARP